MSGAVEQRDNNGGKMLGGITGKGFMPGQSGNPAGRAKGTGLTDIIRKCLAQPDETYGTKADKLIALVIEHAEKGDFRYFKEIMDRMDGPVPSKTEVSGEGGSSLVFHIVEAKPPNA